MTGAPAMLSKKESSDRAFGRGHPSGWCQASSGPGDLQLALPSLPCRTGSLRRRRQSAIEVKRLKATIGGDIATFTAYF